MALDGAGFHSVRRAYPTSSDRLLYPLMECVYSQPAHQSAATTHFSPSAASLHRSQQVRRRDDHSGLSRHQSSVCRSTYRSALPMTFFMQPANPALTAAVIPPAHQSRVYSGYHYGYGGGGIAASQHQDTGALPNRQSYPLAHCPAFVPGAHNLLAEHVPPPAMVSSFVTGHAVTGHAVTHM